MKKVLLVAALLLAFAVPAFADWTGTTADRNISYWAGEPYITANNKKIAVGPEGNLYVIWRQSGGIGTFYEIYFGMSTDNGATWSSDTGDRRISADDGQHACGLSPAGEKPMDIDVDNLGNIYVVWAESLGSVDAYEIMLLKSTDQGQTWQHSDTDFPISNVGQSTVHAYDPAMAIDHNDNLYVVWHQINPNDTTEIHIGKSTDLGDTWSSSLADRYISFADDFPGWGADIAIDMNNNIYVVWQEKETVDETSRKINYGKSTDGGVSFNSETADFPISTGIRNATDVYMVADQQNNIFVSWRATMASAIPFYYDVYFSATTDGGNTWSGSSSPIMVDHGSADGSGAYYPSLVVTSEGNLAAFWNETPTGYSNSEVFASYSFDGGATWTGNTSMDIVSFPDGHGATNPDVAVSPGDTLHVIWHEGVSTSGYYDIHYSKGDTLGTSAPVPGAIAGHVFETNGTTPILGVFVETFDSLDQRVEADTTDALGAYQVSLYPGTYREHFSKDGYDSADLSGIVILSGQTTPVSVNLSTISGCIYLPGDINSNGYANGIDVVYGVTYLKGGAVPPDTCADCPAAGQRLYAAMDVNGNCATNGIDITFYVAYLKGIQPTLRWCPDCPPASRRN